MRLRERKRLGCVVLCVSGKFIFTDSNGEQLFCLSTNWTFNLLA